MNNISELRQNEDVGGTNEEQTTDTASVDGAFGSGTFGLETFGDEPDAETEQEAN